MRSKLLLIILIVFGLFISFCSCNRDKENKDSLTKKTAKFLTKKSIEAVEGVSEAIKDDGEQLAKTATEASGEVISGTAQGLSDLADKKGNEIGRNLGNVTAKTLTGYVRSLEDNLSDTELNIPSSSSDKAVVLSVTKVMFQADSINAYILFKTKGNYELTLRLRDETNKIVGEAYEHVKIESRKPTYMSINFGYGNSEPIRKSRKMELIVEDK